MFHPKFLIALSYPLIDLGVTVQIFTALAFFSPFVLSPSGLPQPESAATPTMTGVSCANELFQGELFKVEGHSNRLNWHHRLIVPRAILTIRKRIQGWKNNTILRRTFLWNRHVNWSVQIYGSVSQGWTERMWLTRHFMPFSSGNESLTACITSWLAYPSPPVWHRNPQWATCHPWNNNSMSRFLLRIQGKHPRI